MRIQNLLGKIELTAEFSDELILISKLLIQNGITNFSNGSKIKFEFFIIKFKFAFKKSKPTGDIFFPIFGEAKNVMKLPLKLREKVRTLFF